ncbi:MAG: hypothetical protein H6559_37390 [Lewinellaceae bacterium]|nr:hypothetical protein [Lewinellaceae bacterium]
MAGFSFDGGCDVTDNSASIPARRFDLAAVQLHLYRHLHDGCQDMASCSATFTVALLKI